MYKYSEINKLDSATIKSKVVQLKKELFELNLQKNTTNVEKTHTLRGKRRDVARLLTALNAKVSK